MRYRERKGHWPLLKPKAKEDAVEDGESNEEAKDIEMGAMTPDTDEISDKKMTAAATEIQEVRSGSS